jgi:hypothetical protein
MSPSSSGSKNKPSKEDCESSNRGDRTHHNHRYENPDPAELKMYVGNEKREFARRKGGSELWMLKAQNS